MHQKNKKITVCGTPVSVPSLKFYEKLLPRAKNRGNRLLSYCPKNDFQYGGRPYTALFVSRLPCDRRWAVEWSGSSDEDKNSFRHLPRRISLIIGDNLPHAPAVDRPVTRAYWSGMTSKNLQRRRSGRKVHRTEVRDGRRADSGLAVCRSANQIRGSRNTVWKSYVKKLCELWKSYTYISFM